MASDPSLNPQISEGEVVLTHEQSQFTPLNDEEAIPAVPINYCVPSNSIKDNDCDTFVIEKRMNERTQRESSSSSKRGRRCKTLPPEWEANWTVNYKARTNGSGRIDKHYTHNATKFKCRSIVEVEKYEMNQIQLEPKRKVQVKKDKDDYFEKEVKEQAAMEENDDGLRVDGKLVVEKEEDVNTKQMGVNVEEFLAEAHYNLLHKFDP